MASALAALALVSGRGLTAPGAAAGPYPSAVQPDALGVNMQYVYALGRQPSATSPGWKPFIDLAMQSGITVVREDAAWATAEPNRPNPTTGAHTYTWANPGNNLSYDKWTGDLADDGIRWQPIIDYSTKWSSTIQGDDLSPPLMASDFATYAAAFARRYGRGGDFWKTYAGTPRPVTTYEIWNEENGQWFWHTGCDPARYSDLFIAAADAIHGVDPAAAVVVGGVADVGASSAVTCSGVSFVQALKPSVFARAGGVGFHPYGPRGADTEHNVSQFRAALDGIHQAAMPLYLTEFGWIAREGCTGPTLPVGTNNCGGAIPDADRATALRMTVPDLALSNCLVRNITIYTWRTPETDHNNPEHWYGIVRAQLDPVSGRPQLWGSGQAFAATVMNLEGLGGNPPPTGPVQVCAGRP